MRTRILATALAWVAAVAAVASIAWLAIDTAGRQVAAAPIALPLPRGPVAPAVPEITTVSLPTPDPTTRRSTPSAGPKSIGTSSPEPSATRSANSEAEPDPPGTTGTARSSTYSTEAGRVRASCAGARITLAGGYAQPATGWSVRVRDGGPDHLRVRFEAGGTVVLVVAVCVEGRPRFAQFRVEEDRDRADRDSERSFRSARKE